MSKYDITISEDVEVRETVDIDLNIIEIITDNLNEDEIVELTNELLKGRNSSNVLQIEIPIKNLQQLSEIEDILQKYNIEYSENYV